MGCGTPHLDSDPPSAAPSRSYSAMLDTMPSKGNLIDVPTKLKQEAMVKLPSLLSFNINSNEPSQHTISQKPSQLKNSQKSDFMSDILEISYKKEEIAAVNPEIQKQLQELEKQEI